MIKDLISSCRRRLASRETKHVSVMLLPGFPPFDELRTCFLGNDAPNIHFGPSLYYSRTVNRSLARRCTRFFSFVTDVRHESCNEQCLQRASFTAGGRVRVASMSRICCAACSTCSRKAGVNSTSRLRRELW